MANVIGYRPKLDKKTRMNGETPKLQSGCLILPKSAPWLDDFLLEYLAFPYGKHDDHIDALSQFLIWRTAEESRVLFNADFGNYDHESTLGAPSAEDILWGACARLSPPFRY
jgi:hypothetical protein